MPYHYRDDDGLCIFCGNNTVAGIPFDTRALTTILPVILLGALLALGVATFVFIKFFGCIRRALFGSQVFRALDRCCGRLISRLL